MVYFKSILYNFFPFPCEKIISKTRNYWGCTKSPQQYCSDLEGWTPFIFKNIKAYPSKLYINILYIQKQETANFKQGIGVKEAETTCLINIRMIYFGQEANLSRKGIVSPETKMSAKATRLRIKYSCTYCRGGKKAAKVEHCVVTAFDGKRLFPFLGIKFNMKTLQKIFYKYQMTNTITKAFFIYK